MQEKFNQLRKEYPVFTFESYDIKELEENIEITYYFNIGESIVFSPKWFISKSKYKFDYNNDIVINKLIFNLGLVELISYWKIMCSPKVVIKAGYIDEKQISWWKNQYFLGLGEFFYTNNITTNDNDFMEIKVTGEPIEGEQSSNYEKSGCLIPVGGGKDSVVTMELLKDYKDTNLCYIINPRETTLSCAHIAGYDDGEIVDVKRTLDKRMLELNKQGYLNGHTPFSAIVAFSSVLLAYVHNKKYVVLSNESSANEGTIVGTQINHQYSKSFKFEKDFNEYENNYIRSNVKYFSILRPFSELQIARYFSRYKKYFHSFKSCNAGSKEDIWCCNCSKCLFVFIILSPFIALDELTKIFGDNLLDNKSLKNIFDKLIGLEPEKPFECVGTCEEVNAAICMAINKLEKENRTIPELYDYYKSLDSYKDYSDNKNNLLRFFDEENLIPYEFVQNTKRSMLDD